MRGLKLVVISMGVLIVAGFVVLVSQLGSRIASLSAGDGTTPFALGLGAPAGSTVEAMTAAGELLAVHIRRPDGSDRIYVVDPAGGRHLGTIGPEAEAP